jgi:hypothetical protein
MRTGPNPADWYMILNVSPRDSAGTRGTFFSIRRVGENDAKQFSGRDSISISLLDSESPGICRAAPGSETAAAATRIGIRVI